MRSLALLSLVSLSLVAFTPSPLHAKTRLEKKLEEKLKAPFLKQAPWFTDYERARDAARKAKKPILAYFTASFFPCPPCLHLERGLLASKEFVAWSKGAVLLCHVTTKIRGRAHDDLHMRKGGSAFPYVTFLSPEGLPLSEVVDPTKLESYRKALKEVTRYRDLRARMATLKPAERGELLGQEIEYMSLSSVAAQKVALGLRGKVPAELMAGLERALKELPAREQDAQILARFYAAKLQTARDVAKRGPALGKAFLELYRKGIRPHRVRARELYYMFVWRYAAGEQDRAAAKIALDGLSKLGRRGKGFADAQREAIKGWPQKAPSSRPQAPKR